MALLRMATASFRRKGRSDSRQLRMESAGLGLVTGGIYIPTEATALGKAVAMVGLAREEG